MIGRLLYGGAFVLGVPCLLVLWARALDLGLPALSAPIAGGCVAAAGVVLVLSGWGALWVHGGGLPMNAYPPPRYVTRGAYALTRQPIYVGFVLACAGAAIAVGSASGLFVVTPLAALACAALVFGYERPDLERRFGAPLPSPWLRVAEDADRPPTWGERLGAYALALVPWGILYEAVAFLGPAPDAVSGALALDRAMPVVEEAEVVYASVYVVVLAAPLLARRARDLRRFVTRGLLAMALIFPLYLLVPLVAPPRPFVPHGPLGHVLLLERALDTPAGAFPSFHVVWALLAAEIARGGVLKIAARTWAWAVAASCLLTGMHTLVDVLAGALAALAVVRAHRVWELARALAERAAGSWREWRVGPLRVINHGLWAGLGTFVGLVVVGALAGRAYHTPMLLAAGAGLVGSAIWAQVVEGSPSLLRPYGFYGGVLGIVGGAIVATLARSQDPWPLLGAYATTAPWVQAIGRVRCLVQGCCHGRPAAEGVGIRYTHPRSRVCAIAHLAGAPLHATPLYSILWNVLVGAALARMWSLRAPLHVIGGIYLVLGGLGRFVEESYRGEPQTRIVARLRVYQWIGAAQVLAGVATSALGRGGSAPAAAWLEAPLGAALAGGFVAAVALGVDFPRSSARFSRLA